MYVDQTDWESSCRGRRNEEKAEEMIKGRDGTIVNLGLQSRHRSTIILESSPSAEIASYDYEATLSESELEKSHADDSEVKTSSLKESTLKTVCFSTDNQIYEKFTSNTEIRNENKITLQQECAACKNIVSESGDEGEDVNNPITDSKELPNNPVSPVEAEEKKGGQVCSDRKETNERITPETKTSSKEYIAKKKIVNSSLLDRKKNSKIPRATGITCAPSRVYQTARIPSRGNSKTSLCKRSFFTTRSKPKKRQECTDTKADLSPCEESPRTQVGSAGDHPSPLSTISVLRNLRSNNACRSCNDPRETVNLKLSIHDVQEPWSDSRSSPEIRTRDPWSKSLKMHPYIESTSEEVDLSSEYSSDSLRPERKKCFTEKASSKSPILRSGYTRNSPRLRPRRRLRKHLQA